MTFIPKSLVMRSVRIANSCAETVRSVQGWDGFWSEYPKGESHRQCALINVDSLLTAITDVMSHNPDLTRDLSHSFQHKSCHGITSTFCPDSLQADHATKQSIEQDPLFPWQYWLCRGSRAWQDVWLVLQADDYKVMAREAVLHQYTTMLHDFATSTVLTLPAGSACLFKSHMVLLKGILKTAGYKNPEGSTSEDHLLQMSILSLTAKMHGFSTQLDTKSQARAQGESHYLISYHLHIIYHISRQINAQA